MRVLWLHINLDLLNDEATPLFMLAVTLKLSFFFYHPIGEQGASEIGNELIKHRNRIIFLVR